MKKIILGALIFGMALSASAQTNSDAFPTAAKYTDHVSTNDQIRQMATQLRLNEGQYIRFRDVSKARAGQIAELNNLYANDPAMRQAKINAVNKAFDEQLAQSLTSTQFTAYLKAVGQYPTATNTNLEATGYGGRSFETGTNPVKTSVSEQNDTDTSDSTSTKSLDNVKTKSNQMKVDSEVGELKTRKKRKDKKE